MLAAVLFLDYRYHRLPPLPKSLPCEKWRAKDGEGAPWLQSLSVPSQVFSRVLSRRDGRRGDRGRHAYHFVDLERGVRHNGRLIASDIQGHIAQIRSIAQHEGLSQSGLERIEKAERVVPKMQATIEFVSGYVKQQVAQLDLTPVSLAMHAKLIPSYYLDRVAETRTVSDGTSFRELAERLCAPLFGPGGALSALSCETQDQLHNLVRKLLKRASFTSVEDLEAKALAFIEYCNATMAKPCKWTYGRQPPSV